MRASAAALRGKWRQGESSTSTSNSNLSDNSQNPITNLRDGLKEEDIGQSSRKRQQRNEDEGIKGVSKKIAKAAVFHSANCLEDQGLSKSVGKLEREFLSKTGAATPTRRQRKSLDQLRNVAIEQVAACFHEEHSWCASLTQDGIISVWDYDLYRCLYRVQCPKLSNILPSEHGSSLTASAGGHLPMYKQQQSTSNKALNLFFHGEGRLIVVFETSLVIYNYSSGSIRQQTIFTTVQRKASQIPSSGGQFNNAGVTQRTNQQQFPSSSATSSSEANTFPSFGAPPSSYSPAGSSSWTAPQYVELRATGPAGSLGEQMVVFGCSDGGVRLWNLTGEKIVAQLPIRHRAGVKALAVLPVASSLNGNRGHAYSHFNLLSGSADGSIVLWRVHLCRTGVRKPGCVDLLDRSGWLDLEGSGRLTLSARDDIVHPGGVIAFSQHKEDYLISSFGRDGAIVLWNLRETPFASTAATALRRWTTATNLDIDVAHFVFARMPTSSLPSGALIGSPFRDGRLFGFADAADVLDIMQGVLKPQLYSNSDLGPSALGTRELLQLQEVGSLWQGLYLFSDRKGRNSVPRLRKLFQHPHKPNILCAVSDHGVHVVRCTLEPHLRLCTAIPKCGRVALFFENQLLRVKKLSSASGKEQGQTSRSGVSQNFQEEVDQTFKPKAIMPFLFDEHEIHATPLLNEESSQEMDDRNDVKGKWPGAPDITAFARVGGCLLAIVWPHISRYMVLSLTNCEQGKCFSDWNIKIVDRGWGHCIAWSWTPREIIISRKENSPPGISDPRIATLVVGTKTRYRTVLVSGQDEIQAFKKKLSFRARKRMTSFVMSGSASLRRGSAGSAESTSEDAGGIPLASSTAANSSGRIGRSSSNISVAGGGLDLTTGKISLSQSSQQQKQKSLKIPVEPPRLCFSKFVLDDDDVSIDGRQITILSCDPVALHGGGPLLLVSYGSTSALTTISDASQNPALVEEPVTAGSDADDSDSFTVNSADSDSMSKTSLQSLNTIAERDTMAFKSRFYYWTTLPAPVSDHDAAALEIGGKAAEIDIVKLRSCGDPLVSPVLVQWSCMGSAVPFLLAPGESSLTCALAYGNRVEMLTLTTLTGVQTTRAGFRWQGTVSAPREVLQIQWYNRTLLLKTEDELRAVFWGMRIPEDPIPLAKLRQTLEKFREKAVLQKDPRSVTSSVAHLARLRRSQQNNQSCVPTYTSTPRLNLGSQSHLSLNCQQKESINPTNLEGSKTNELNRCTSSRPSFQSFSPHLKKSTSDLQHNQHKPIKERQIFANGENPAPRTCTPTLGSSPPSTLWIASLAPHSRCAPRDVPSFFLCNSPQSSQFCSLYSHKPIFALGYSLVYSSSRASYSLPHRELPGTSQSSHLAPLAIFGLLVCAGLENVALSMVSNSLLPHDHDAASILLEASGFLSSAASSDLLHGLSLERQLEVCLTHTLVSSACSIVENPNRLAKLLQLATATDSVHTSASIDRCRDLGVIRPVQPPLPPEDLDLQHWRHHLQFQLLPGSASHESFPKPPSLKGHKIHVGTPDLTPPEVSERSCVPCTEHSSPEGVCSSSNGVIVSSSERGIPKSNETQNSNEIQGSSMGDNNNNNNKYDEEGGDGQEKGSSAHGQKESQDQNLYNEDSGEDGLRSETSCFHDSSRSEALKEGPRDEEAAKIKQKEELPSPLFPSWALPAIKDLAGEQRQESVLASALALTELRRLAVLLAAASPTGVLHETEPEEATRAEAALERLAQACAFAGRDQDVAFLLALRTAQ